MWKPPAGHPVSGLVARAAETLAMVEYEHQAGVLQELLLKAGEDVFVAAYNVVQREDGSVWSWCAWVRQVTNGLVPRTGYVLLGGNEPSDARFAVRWDDAVTLGREFLRPEEGYDPPLWRYCSWPDSATESALREVAVPFPPPAGA